MRVISKKTLIAFWQTHKDSEQALKAWYDEAMKANWQTPNEIKMQYKSASVVGNNRIVFNICGNKYRLVIAIAYQFGSIYIKFIGTHKEYDGIDVLKIK
jgi:mRNA interferase HigB